MRSGPSLPSTPQVSKSTDLLERIKQYLVNSWVGRLRKAIKTTLITDAFPQDEETSEAHEVLDSGYGVTPSAFYNRISDIYRAAQLMGLDAAEQDAAVLYQLAFQEEGGCRNSLLDIILQQEQKAAYEGGRQGYAQLQEEYRRGRKVSPEHVTSFEAEKRGADLDQIRALNTRMLESRREVEAYLLHLELNPNREEPFTWRYHIDGISRALRVTEDHPERARALLAQALELHNRMNTNPSHEAPFLRPYMDALVASNLDPSAAEQTLRSASASASV